MILEDLIEAYSTFMAVGMVSCLTVVGAWNVFRSLVKW